MSNLCRKAGQKVSALARVAKLLPFKRKRQILKAFIESQFSYCPITWMFCGRQMNNRINHIHERSLRLVYDDYSSSFNELLIKDNSVSIHHRNVQLVAIEMYKIVNDISPPFMREIFQLNLNSTTRSGDCSHRPRVNTVFKGQNSLRAFGPIVWDKMLPEELKSCTNISKFKKEVKKWIPQNCVCRLCKEYVPNLGFVDVSV